MAYLCQYPQLPLTHVFLPLKQYSARTCKVLKIARLLHGENTCRHNPSTMRQ